MEEKKFLAKDIEFGVGVKLHDWVTAILRRKDALKSFCHNVNIDYPIDSSKKYHFPEKYRIEADEIEYLAKHRDKIILAVFEDYKQSQDCTMKELLDLKNNHNTEKEYLEEEKARKISLQNAYKSEKDTIQKLSLEARINNVKASIKNCESNIANIEANIKTDHLLLDENKESWKNQINLVCAAFDTQTKRFIQSSTKKIRRKLNYTDFYYNAPKHSDDVEKVLEGDLYE